MVYTSSLDSSLKFFAQHAEGQMLERMPAPSPAPDRRMVRSSRRRYRTAPQLSYCGGGQARPCFLFGMPSPSDFSCRVPADAARAAAPCRWSSSAARPRILSPWASHEAPVLPNMRLQFGNQRIVATFPGCSTTKALTTVPRVSSGAPITAAFATAGCRSRQFSISEDRYDSHRS